MSDLTDRSDEWLNIRLAELDEQMATEPAFSAILHQWLDEYRRVYMERWRREVAR